MQPFPEALATGRSDFSLPFGRMIHRFSGGPSVLLTFTATLAKSVRSEEGEGWRPA